MSANSYGPDRLPAIFYRHTLLPTLQFAFALISVMLLFTIPLSADRLELNLLSVMLIANATISLVGGIIGTLANLWLHRSVFALEIRKLAAALDWHPKSRPLLALPWVQLLVVLYATLCISLTYLFYRKGLDSWSWQVPAGLAISEAIYLTWAFEGVLMKAELEIIARRWARLQAFRARVPVQLCLFSAVEPTPVTGWEARSRTLLTALLHHGFEVDADSSGSNSAKN